MHLTIAVCTRNRPVELRRLFDSLGRTRFRRSAVPEIDVLVVDNGADVSPVDAADLERRCGWPTRVVCEPRTGVAFARNTAIAHRHPEADLFVGVDDDQVVTPSWLDELVAHTATTTADIVTGPVLVRIPEDAGPMARTMWQNVPRFPTGTRLPSFLGGNVCFRTAVFDATSERYDETQALSTADDADLGRRLTGAGFTIEWTDRAIAWEWVPAGRLTLRWFIERYLSFGGFEVRDARRSGGIPAILMGSARQLVSGTGGAAHLAMSAPGLGSKHRRASHRAEATARLATTAGWYAGLAGWRIRDYRAVTSASTSPRPGSLLSSGTP